MLPLSDSYYVESIRRDGVERGDGCICQNCGQGIVNVATIVNNSGKRFAVGLDCVKTLTSIRNFSDYQQTLYEFDQCLKFLSRVNKAERIEHVDGVIYVEYFDTKGKFRRDFAVVQSLKKYGFQIPESK